MKVFKFVSLLVLVCAVAQAAAPTVPACPATVASTGAFFEARQIETDAGGKLKLSPANILHLKAQREAVRQSLTDLHGRYFEMEHAVRRIMLARMLRTHAFLWGDPGGAKSAVAREILNVPQSKPDGTRRVDVFSLQLNQLLGDAPIRGYLDPARMQAMKAEMTARMLAENAVTLEHIRNEGTIVHFSAALLDELDKGNPVALAALLDILNEKVAQYGPVTVAVRTESIIATSNMRIEEFLQTFREQGMESTARALLDRLLFKVYFPNYVTNPELRRLALRRAGERSANNARDRLANVESRYASSTAVVRPIESRLPEVDWSWLGDLAVAGSSVGRDAQRVIDEMFGEVRSRFYAIRRASEQAAQESNQPGAVVYYPPTIFSTRNYLQFTTDVVAVSVFLDLLALPEETLPTETLVRLIQRGIPIDRFSAWRLQDVVLTAAPGDPVLQVTGQGGATQVTLAYGPQVQELLKDTFDERQKAILGFIVQEREAMVSVLTDILARNQAKVEEVSALLAELLGPQAGVDSIEKFLMLAAPRPAAVPSGRP